MGTTSEKLTYLNGTKQLLKDKINNLGGSIDDNTTFRQYANQLQNVYDNLPKTSYQEGTEVTLESCLKGKLDYEEDNGKKVVGIGQSSQDSTKGYQLINIEDTTTEVVGITITISGGVITINGTASRNNTFQFNAKTTTTLNGDYILASNYVSGTRSGDANFNVRDNSTSSAIFNVSLTTSQVTNTASLNNTIKYGIYVASGATFNNYVFKPMLESGSTAHDWEKYTGGYSSPSPNWEQPIEYVRGKNRFADIATQTLNGITLTRTDNGYILNGTSTAVTTFRGTIPNPINSNKTLVAKCDTDIANANIQVKTRSATQVQLRSISLATKETWVVSSGEYEDVLCDIVVKSGVTLNNVLVQPMLLEGTYTTNNITPYLPYNTIEEVVEGKNLFSSVLEVGTFTNSGLNNTSTNRLRSKDYIAVQPNTTYTMSVTNNTTYTLTASVSFYNKNDFTTPRTSYLNWSTGNILTFETPSDCTYIRTLFNLENSTITVDRLTNVMLERSNQATTYEPYITPTSYQLSLGDIELNAIGNYKDELIYDVENDKVYKNKAINKVSLKTLDWETASVGTNSYGTRILMSSIGKVVTDINIISSHAKGIMFNDRNTYSGTSIYDETNGYVVFRNTSFTSLEDFTTFLNNNNVYAYYVLVTAQKQEITTTLKDQIKALYNAQSINGTTIITSNGNLPMIIKVRGLKGE